MHWHLSEYRNAVVNGDFYKTKADSLDVMLALKRSETSGYLLAQLKSMHQSVGQPWAESIRDPKADLQVAVQHWQQMRGRQDSLVLATEIETVLLTNFTLATLHSEIEHFRPKDSKYHKQYDHLIEYVRAGSEPGTPMLVDAQLIVCVKLIN